MKKRRLKKWVKHLLVMLVVTPVAMVAMLYFFMMAVLQESYNLYPLTEEEMLEVVSND